MKRKLKKLTKEIVIDFDKKKMQMYIEEDEILREGGLMFEIIDPHSKEYFGGGYVYLSKELSSGGRV